MLSSLIIKNFALIENQTIEFKRGFNVLVGETGAGKSLILDALSFVLGEKANKVNLRSGESKMFVQAIFDELNLDVISFLSEQGIDCEDGLILTRSYTIEGKNECRINGIVVPTAILKSLGLLLVDTYAQNENIELLKVKNHLTILDGYGEHEIVLLKKQIEEKLNDLSEISKQMQNIGGNNTNRERELELLDYQIKDIQNAKLQQGEDEEIKARLNVLINYEKIFDNVNTATKCLDSIVDNVFNVQNYINNASKYDSNFIEIEARLNSAKLELSDINETLIDNMSKLEFDSDELATLDSRLEEIKLLKKKYGNSIEEILAYLETIKVDYDNLLFGEEKLNKLQSLHDSKRKELYGLCKQLSDIRRKIALKIENNIMQELNLLGFKNALFKVKFEDLPELDKATFNKNGLDNVEFLLSANAGQELKSLSKIISGGEMSRFMLALKNVFAKCFNTSTLIFDEVDTGISGEIGQKVAERLAMLSKSYQLICITHLCQVTAMADNYIFVKKEVKNNQTYTKVDYLVGDNLIKYIAIVSGAEPTEVALKFASELKEKAEDFKQNI